MPRELNVASDMSTNPAHLRNMGLTSSPSHRLQAESTSDRRTTTRAPLKVFAGRSLLATICVCFFCFTIAGAFATSWTRIVSLASCQHVHTLPVVLHFRRVSGSSPSVHPYTLTTENARRGHGTAPTGSVE